MFVMHSAVGFGMVRDSHEALRTSFGTIRCIFSNHCQDYGSYIMSYIMIGGYSQILAVCIYDSTINLFPNIK